MKTLRLALLVTGTLLASTAAGCATRTTSLQVLQPAEVLVPSHINTIGVIDRSRPTGKKEGALAVLEGAVTGEGIGVDREGRQAAAAGVTEVLQASPRFDAHFIAVDKKTAESSLFDDMMSWKAAKKLCKDTGCEAIVALEALDSDSVTAVSSREEERTDKDGNSYTVVVHQATRDTNVKVAFRLYDIEEQRIVDDKRDMGLSRSWSGEADTPGEAMSRLPSQGETVTILSHDVGALYAQRIAPTWVYVSRSWYVKGHDDFKVAKNHVLAGDWAGASEIWMKLTTSPDAKVRGRAEHNLALANEVNGYLEEALGWARKAAIDLGNNTSRSYVGVLEQRINDMRRLQEQMPGPSTEMN